MSILQFLFYEHFQENHIRNYIYLEQYYFDGIDLIDFQDLNRIHRSGLHYL